MRLAWGIVAVLLIFWLLGIGLHVAGSLIHLLLVVAFVVLIIDLLSRSPRGLMEWRSNEHGEPKQMCASWLRMPQRER